MDLYFSSFAKAFLLAFLFSSLVLIAIRYFTKIKNAKRFGGFAVISAFFLTVLSDSNLIISEQLEIVLAGTTAVLLFGLLDDYFNFSWKIQFVFQLILSGSVAVSGVRIHYISNPFSDGMIFFNTDVGILFAIILTIIWIMLVINAINWFDGVDGLSAGAAFFTGIVIFILSLKPEVNQPPIGIIAVILSGSMLGFLFFNFNPSKIIAGTSGAFFIGFILAMLAIFAGVKIATTLMVLLLPMFDFFWVIGERLKDGHSIFKGNDGRHIHCKLKMIGWSERKISLFTYGLTCIIGLAALFATGAEKVATLAVFGAILASFYIQVGRKLKQQTSQ